MARRYFEFVEGSSSKFWEVWVEGNECRTRYGKIGAAGQTTVKDEGSAAGAQKLHDKLVKEKTGKGYVEKGRVSNRANEAVKPAETRSVSNRANEVGVKPAETRSVSNRANEARVKLAAAPPPVPTEVIVEEGWRRWENTEDGSSKFWEIKVDEESFTVRFGKIGTKGQEKTTELEDPSFVEDESDKLIAEKVKKGYRPVGKHGPDTGATNPELEDKIAAAIDDPTGYLVYADWLSGQSDPRGELIVLQHQAEQKAELWKTSTALIKKHKERFFGSVADFEAGDEQEMTLEWKNGFITAATLKWPMYSDDLGADRKAAKQLKAFLALPVAKFLRSLRLGPSPSDDEMTFQGFVDSIAAQPPAHLETLFLGEISDWDISGTSSGDFSEVAKACPALKAVTLHAGNISIGKVDLTELRAFTVESGSLDREAIKDLCAMKAPKLERLSVWFGSENYGASGGVKDIMPILNGAFPKLSHLGIMNCEFVNEAVEALTKSKLLKQLKTLDLSMGCLTDDSISKMAASGAYAHLDLLNVDDNGLSDPKLPALKGLAKSVVSKEQDVERANDDGWRFCSVGE